MLTGWHPLESLRLHVHRTYTPLLEWPNHNQRIHSNKKVLIFLLIDITDKIKSINQLKEIDQYKASLLGSLAEQIAAARAPPPRLPGELLFL